MDCLLAARICQATLVKSRNFTCPVQSGVIFTVPALDLADKQDLVADFQVCLTAAELAGLAGRLRGRPSYVLHSVWLKQGHRNGRAVQAVKLNPSPQTLKCAGFGRDPPEPSLQWAALHGRCAAGQCKRCVPTLSHAGVTGGPAAGCLPLVGH